MKLSHVAKLPYTAEQRLEAAKWFIEIRESADPSPDLLRRWLCWLAESEGNRIAFHAIGVAWSAAARQLESGMTATHLDDEPDDEHYDPSISIEEWKQQRASHNRTGEVEQLERSEAAGSECRSGEPSGRPHRRLAARS